MKKSKKIKKGLAILLCACMVPGTTPLPAQAESVTEGFVAETENTNGAFQTPAGVEPENNTESNSEPQTPAASESEIDAENNTPSQEPVPVENEKESESFFSSSQDPIVIEPETEPGTEPFFQDPVEEVQRLLHALPDAKEITEENLEEVMAQLDAIDEAKATLSEEQTARLDFTRYDEAAAAVMALMGMEGANEIVTLTIYDTKTVSYIGENGTQTSHLAEIVTGQSYQNETVKWGENSSNDRYYVVEGNVSIDGLIEVTGTAHLILADGATLNAKRGIKVSSGNNLYICAQSGNSGKLIADSAYGAAIGGVQTGTSSGTANMNQPNAGNIYIFGGNITATTAIDYAAAIGGAQGGQGGSVTVCGGTVRATSKSGDGIGGGASFYTDYNGRKGSATIYANSITGGNSSNWNGIVYINKEITIYGNGTLTEDFTVPKGYTFSAPNGSATLTINQGVTLTLEGTLKDGISIINNGTLINNSSFTENGTFTNNGTFQNNGDAVFNGKVSNTKNAAIIINNASLKDYSTLTVGKNADFENQGTINLVIGRSVMVNNGTVTNSGSIIGDGPVENYGTVTNNGTWGNSKITNSTEATFTNNAGHTVSIQVFDNQGKLVNHGSFEGKTTYEAKITNSGSLQNNSSINVRDIENTGTATNAQGAACTVNNILTNRGTFTNNGTVTVSSMAYNAGKLFNYSTWTANYNMYNGKIKWNGDETYADAVIENYGTITAGSEASTFENYASIKNQGSINVGGQLSIKENSSLSGNAIHMAERSVTYIQADGSAKTEKLEYDWPADNTLNSGNCLLDTTLSSLTVNGDVTLILTKDSTIEGSITVNEGSTLTLYTAAGSTCTLKANEISGSGKVIVNSGKLAAGGSISQLTLNNGEVTADNIGQVTVHSGNIKVTGEITELTVYDGEVTAGSIGTAKISRGIISARTVGKAEGMSDCNGVILADKITEMDGFKGIAFNGSTGGMYGMTTLILDISFTVPQGKTLKIKGNESLIIPKGIVLTYAGTIEIEASGILYKVDDSCLKQEGTGNIIGSVATNTSESLVTYVLPDGTSHEAFAKPVAENATELAAPEGTSEAWYTILEDVTLTSRLEIKGNINLILTDGLTLDAKKGIHVPDGSSLTIYGQSAGTGTVKANGDVTTQFNGAGIGGNDGESYGNITINGGIIETCGSWYGAGIGGGETTAADAKVGKIVINGGNVTAKGYTTGYGAGIGGGWYGRGEVEINGGIIDAAGGKNGAGIGGGRESWTYNEGGYSGKSIIKINGGEVRAKAGEDAAGIGSGTSGGAEITITGGKVVAEDCGNSGYSTAIGSGANPQGDYAIRITGGEVTVQSKYKGIGTSTTTTGNAVVAIEGGAVKVTCEMDNSIKASGEKGASVTISGGQVIVSAKQYTCIYASSILISGGVVDAANANSNIWYGTIGYYTNDVTISGGIVKARNQSSDSAIRAKKLTLDGNAVIYASNEDTDSLVNVEEKVFSSGIIFENVAGSIYGSPIPDSNWEIPEGFTLTIADGQDITIPAGVTLTNNGSIGIENGGQLSLRGTLDTTNGTVTNKGTIQSVNGTINGENKISSMDGGSLIKEYSLAVTVGTNGKVPYGTDYEISYKFENGTEAPQAKVDSYHEQYASKAGTQLQGKPTDIGDYTVTVSYQTEDGIPCRGSAEFSIIKAASTLTEYPKAETLTYNGAEQVLLKAGATNDGTIQYKLGEDGEWSEEIPKAKNAGDYVVYYQITGDDTHYDMEARPVNARIEKKEITVTITPNGGTYEGMITPAQAVLEGAIDGENPEVTLTYTGTANDGTETGNAETGSAEVPTKAGTYTVTATLSDPNTNYELTGTTEAEFTVARASAELAVGKVREKRLGDKDFQLEVTRKGDGALRYESSDANVLTVSEDGTVSITGDGTATITVFLEESANYLKSTAAVTVTVKKALNHGTHSFDEDGFCKECGAYQPAGQREAGTYEIGNVGQLYWFAGLVNGDETVCIGDITQNKSANAVLTADITDNTGVLKADAEIRRIWTPIGAGNGYSGSFDGQSHTISGLYFDDANADEVGLFGHTAENSQVSNVGITDSYFNGNDYVGAVCGKNEGIIRNCYNAGIVSGNKWVGGVSGYNNHYNARVANCYNIGTIYAKQQYYADGVAYSGAGETYNSYYLAGCAADGTVFKADYPYNESKTAEQFTGGEVAYLLSQGYTFEWAQGCESYDGSAWGQDLSTKGSWPVLDSTKKVYWGYQDCSGKTYANEPLSETPNHKEFDANGFCTTCGGYQPAVKNAKGIYEISNAGQLYWFAGLVNGTLDYLGQDRVADAVLTKDITVNSNVLNPDGTLAGEADSLRSWTPIGTGYTNQYAGTFDGQNHTISGLYLDEDKADVGLFGSIGYDYNDGDNKNARISNVNIVDSYFNAVSNVGGLCGQSSSGTFIENCRTAGTVIGARYVGGICGENAGTIQTCINTGAVSGSDSSIGGICGTDSYSGIMVNCYNTGVVSGNSSVGGMCGYISGTIVNSYNIGMVSGSESDESSSIGAVCGLNSYGTIVNCYYLEGCAAEGTIFNSTDGESKTAAQFANGEITHLLDQEYKDIGYQVTYDGAVWGQKLGEDGDLYPVFSKDKVYRNETYAGCTGKPGEPEVEYSNTKADTVYAEHTDGNSDGRCDICNKQLSGIISGRMFTDAGQTLNGNMTGLASYPLDAEVTLAAPAVTGYNFLGWYEYTEESPYYTGENLCTSRTYRFSAEGDRNLVAVYKPVGSASLTINGGKNFTVNGDSKTTEITAAYLLGNQVTVECSDSDFDYWKNSVGMVVSRERSYTFTVTGQETISAVFNTIAADKATLVFESYYGQIIARDQYGKDASVPEPDLPFRYGYTVLGWDYDGDGTYDAGKDTPAAALERAFASDTKMIKILPAYELKEVTYHIEVADGSGTGDYRQNEVVTVVANEPNKGWKFSHWEDNNGTILSYNRTYQFYAAEDMYLRAIYVDDTSVVEAKGTTAIIEHYIDTDADTDTGKKKIIFVSMSTVPKGCTIDKAGVIATDNEAVGTSGDGFNASTAKYVMGNAWSGNAYRYTLSIKNTQPGKTWYVRAYLVYTDAEGNMNTIYGDMVSQTMEE